MNNAGTSLSDSIEHVTEPESRFFLALSLVVVCEIIAVVSLSVLNTENSIVFFFAIQFLLAAIVGLFVIQPVITLFFFVAVSLLFLCLSSSFCLENPLTGVSILAGTTVVLIILRLVHCRIEGRLSGSNLSDIFFCATDLRAELKQKKVDYPVAAAYLFAISFSAFIVVTVLYLIFHGVSATIDGLAGSTEVLFFLSLLGGLLIYGVPFWFTRRMAAWIGREAEGNPGVKRLFSIHKQPWFAVFPVTLNILIGITEAMEIGFANIEEAWKTVVKGAEIELPIKSLVDENTEELFARLIQCIVIYFLLFGFINYLSSSNGISPAQDSISQRITILCMLSVLFALAMGKVGLIYNSRRQPYRLLGFILLILFFWSLFPSGTFQVVFSRLGELSVPNFSGNILNFSASIAPTLLFLSSARSKLILSLFSALGILAVWVIFVFRTKPPLRLSSQREKFFWSCAVCILLLIVFIYDSAPFTIQKRCILPSGFTCYTYAIDQSGNLRLDVGQATGKDIAVKAIGCNTTTQRPPANVVLNHGTPVTILNGGHAQIANATAGYVANCCTILTEPCRAKLAIEYYYVNSNTNRTLYGDISGPPENLG